MKKVFLSLVAIAVLSVVSCKKNDAEATPAGDTTVVAEPVAEPVATPADTAKVAADTTKAETPAETPAK